MTAYAALSNVAYNHTYITLTNNLLTATMGATAGNMGACADSFQTSGKYYWEVTPTVITNSGNYAIGVANGAVNAGGEWAGDGNGVGILSNGTLYLANASQGALVSYAAGNTVCIALDITNQLIWFRNGAGLWNNSGSANPATGTGGISISTLSGTTKGLTPFSSMYYINDSFTVNFGASAYAQTPPTGFSNWPVGAQAPQVNPHILWPGPGMMTWNGGTTVKQALNSGSNSVAPSSALCVAGGLYYWEVTVNYLGATAALLLGATGTQLQWTGTSNQWLGGEAWTVGYNANGIVQANNATLSTIQTYTTGSVISVALDLANNLIYFRVNGGNWNNSSTANPATQTGGISISGVMGNTASLRPAVASYNLGDSLTLNMGNSTFAYTPPTGFSAPTTFVPSIAQNADVPIGFVDKSVACPAVTAQPPAGTGQCFTKANSRAWQGSLIYTPASTNTHISGVVTENGSVPLYPKKVFLFDPVDGRLLGSTTSDTVTGAYSINALGRTNVMAVAQDPLLQAMIFDRLTPL